MCFSEVNKLNMITTVNHILYWYYGLLRLISDTRRLIENASIVNVCRQTKFNIIQLNDKLMNTFTELFFKYKLNRFLK